MQIHAGMKTRWRRLGWVVAAVAAGAAAWVATAYTRDMAVARAHASLGSRVAETKCGPIEYAVRGQGPPVLVVHGAGGGFDQGLMLGESLRGFQVIAPSRFGYLRSPSPPQPTPEAQADAYACLLDGLNVRRAAVVGVSAGGPSTMQLCLRHPERCSAMVLLVPLAWSDEPPAAERLTPAKRYLMERTMGSDFGFWAATHLFRGAMVESILGTPLADLETASAADQRRTEELLHLIEPVSRRAQGLRNDMLMAQALRRYPLEKIAAPTLVASVENCGYHTYGPARYTAAHIPGAKFIGYPRGGHLWLGHQAELAAEVSAFLRSAGPTTAMR